MRFRAAPIGSLAFACSVLAACGSAGGTGLLDVGATTASNPVPPSSSSPSAGASGSSRSESGSGAAVTPTTGWHLWLTVRRVQVRLTQDPSPTNTDNSNDTSSWYSVFNGSRRIDLFGTGGVEVPLGSVTLPPARVTQIRLVLASRPELMTPSSSATVRCPSCTESGLELKPKTAIAVKPAARVHATLVFDSRRSLFSTPQGYVLRPVVSVTLTLGSNSGA